MSTARETTHLDDATLEWLRQSGYPATSVERLGGDVSPRRYYRVRSSRRPAAVLAAYPEDDKRSCERFAEVSALLTERGVPTPAILAADTDLGLMLLQDLGDETLYTLRGRGWRYLSPGIERAATLIPVIASLSPEAVAAINPPLDRSLLAAELRKTWKLALGVSRIAESGLPGAVDGRLDTALITMIDRLAETRSTPCHRDFMARNLMPADSAPAGGRTDADPGVLYVIDHQDLRIGPHTYDLASLLNDSLFAPAELERSLVDSYFPSPEDRLDYHRAAAQRALKIVGTYLGFAARGESRHLPLVEPSLRRARSHLAALPELAGSDGAVEELAEALLEAALRARSAPPLPLDG